LLVLVTDGEKNTQKLSLLFQKKVESYLMALFVLLYLCSTF